ncbi:lantibiotic dehydratase C-terminal domain-containing protein [Deinococcus aquaedulcis]|uniref:lantibiotic dehydratase C-terminal domain-containing protein n=1 Tax=Deinococcus aquaedulcis TaxID=2840455 RepID=UPI001C8394B0|nr:lantibiotic dehydratase C-terminal domain-containing protein [Deinococcus aquaedulcis]
MSGWVTAHLRWEALPKPEQVAAVRRALDDLNPEVRRWHYLWHAGSGLHLRVRVCCRGAGSRARVARHLQGCADEGREGHYPRDLHKFGGARVYPHYEALFQASSERAARTLAQPDPLAAVRTGVADTSALLGTFPCAAQGAARRALLTHARRHLGPDPDPGGLWGAALQRTPAAWQPALPPATADHDPLAGALQLLHLHLNRLALGPREEALVYWAAGRNLPATPAPEH